MPAVQVTIHLPADLWCAMQALATHEGDGNTVLLRALAEYLTAAAKRRDCRSGTY